MSRSVPPFEKGGPGGIFTVKSPTPSLRGAKRRGNLTNIRLVTRLPLGRELGAERLRGVYPEPVEGLAMTKPLFSVIPAKAGIQEYQGLLDPGFRRGDASDDFLRIPQLCIL